MSTLKLGSIESTLGKITDTEDIATESGTIGYGQTWQDVTASRAVNVNYTNNTGKPITIIIVRTHTTALLIGFIIDGISFEDTTISDASRHSASTFIIPNGSNYQAVNGTVSSWLELR